MNTLARFNAFITKTFALWIILGSVVAYYFPTYFTGSIPYVPYLLGVIMFGMGCTLSFKDFKIIFTQPKAVIVGIVAQFLIMPLAAYAIALAFNLPKELAAGLILLGACPGGTASNVVTYLARGNVALSVCMTSACTLLAPVLTPLSFYLLASQWLDIPAWPMFLSVVKIVLAPIVLGLILKLFFRKQVAMTTQALPLVSIVCILTILTAIIGANGQKLVSSGFLVFGIVFLHNAVGYFLGYLGAKICRLSFHDSKAIAIEVGMQNSALGVTLANTYLGPAAAIPSVFAAIWHNVSGPILASVFAQFKDSVAEKEAAEVRAAITGEEQVKVVDNQ
ncbi:bile acid:sodium symporter family protein [Psittacicella hinzii]|uniref:Sodium transporter n=1 Tax=Psittacicella hinzii TaxID=2028575 RepID=A0A3A1YJG7_9GAMM|nr:bile acid:sodium symporter family protein [Psittacicella hinzii]RIY37805.1 sodium transporter [Psittacicella hinzii]